MNSRYAQKHRIESLERRLLLSDPSTVQLFTASSAVFVQNRGQWTDASVRFALRGNGASIGMTDTGAFFQLSRDTGASPPPLDLEASDQLASPSDIVSTSFSIHFDGAKRVRPTGQDRSASVFNYYVGDKSQWRTNVPGFETLVYPKVYRGIDLATSGQSNGLKYEFRVSAGADYRKIKLSYEGISGLSIDEQGRLHILTSVGEVIDDAPYTYQMIDGRKVEVAARYQLVDADTYRFRITGRYDRGRALVIDPNLDWSTYLGGTASDWGNGITTDSFGNAWVTGETASYGWTGGGFDTTYNGGNRDAFVAKIKANGSLVWSSYLGGASDDYGYGIATDLSGDAWVTGSTFSSDWANNGFDTSFNGSEDAFVAKINADGSLAWSSYAGGNGHDIGFGIATDPSGNAWVTGETASSGWASGGFDTSFNGGGSDVFVAKVNAAGSLAWSAFLGGSASEDGYGIATDASGNAYVTGITVSSDFATGGFDTTYNGGEDAFVAKINSDGALSWSSYLGGANSDYVHGITTDVSSNVWLSGTTSSSGWTMGGFDTSFNGGGSDAFVAKINANGSLAWSSYLGGAGNDNGYGIAADPSGSTWMTGDTYSSGWPSGGFDTTFNGPNGTSDAFVVKINVNGSLAWSSYLGGTSYDGGYGIATDSLGNAWVTGYTESYGWTQGAYDLTYNGGGDDGFLAKVSDPLVASAQFVYESTQQIQVKFNRMVLPNSNFAALSVTNVTTAQTINSSLLLPHLSADQITEVWTYTGGILPDGNYQANLPIGSITDVGGNPLVADFTFEFFVLAGDANHDREVDINDLYAIASNWQATGKTFSQGDFNYDGKVDAADLGILASHWQATLPPAAPISLPMTAPTRTPVRTLVL